MKSELSRRRFIAAAGLGAAGAPTPRYSRECPPDAAAKVLCSPEPGPDRV